MARGKNFIVVGQRFGALVVLRRANRDEAKRGGGRPAIWVLQCDCGEQRQGKAWNLLIGKLKACGKNGHHWRNTERKFGRDDALTYKSWAAMKTRCLNQKADNFTKYGALGVTVCDRWRDSYDAFLADMGPRPGLEYSIDRWPNPAGNYEPGNCRWATDAEQRSNQRRSVYVEVDGRRVLLNDYVKSLGLAYPTIYGRLRHGWTLEDAVTVPVKRYKPKSPLKA